MKQNNVIKVLFVEDAVEDAEQVISVLRNHGVAVRPGRATNKDELAAACKATVPDVVLVNPDVRALGVAAVVRQMENTGKDFALIALLARMDDDIVADM